MARYVNLIKLSVGSESVESLIDWQARRSRQRTSDGVYYHLTRMRPKREDEVLAGGSIYWVINRLVQCRQRIVGLDEIHCDDGITRCAILLDPDVVRTEVLPRRPFQGWRYLSVDDAPDDLAEGREAEADLPVDLRRALAEIGVA